MTLTSNISNVNLPVIIGAMGGSGTRVVARILRAAGIFVGSNLNEAEDAMEFVEFYDRWINRYTLRERVPLCTEEERIMAKDFQACVARHRLGIPAYDAPWGWKEPRSHYLLPFFLSRYPKMKFVHLVRDGRDMAFSSNQNQLRKHGDAVLEPALRNAPQPVRSASLWAKINLTIASVGEAQMAERYFLMSFEELCVKPRETGLRLMHFLGYSNVNLDAITALVAPPASIGRWKRIADQNLLEAVSVQADACLRKFGYLPAV